MNLPLRALDSAIDILVSLALEC